MYGSIARLRLGRSMNKLIGTYADKLSLVMFDQVQRSFVPWQEAKEKKARKQVIDRLLEASIFLPLNKKLHSFY